MRSYGGRGGKYEFLDLGKDTDYRLLDEDGQGEYTHSRGAAFTFPTPRVHGMVLSGLLVKEEGFAVVRLIDSASE